jgi:hypothetical protein
VSRLTALREAVTEALDMLDGAGCVFAMCPGPDSPPMDMLSCRVCFAIWTLRDAIGDDQTEIVKARHLDPDMILADGAIILRLSFQRVYVYAKIVKDGHPRRRRYRYDQPVKIRKYT